MQKLASIASVSTERRTDDLLQLIADYQRSIRIAVAGLKKQSGANDLLRAWKIRKIKRTGLLRQPRGKFTFHGTGCRFEIGGRIIDAQFGPSGRYDGFDAWSLKQFAESAFEWQGFPDKHIDTGLQDLEASGSIVCPALDPSQHLYYFVDAVDAPHLKSRRSS